MSNNIDKETINTKINENDNNENNYIELRHVDKYYGEYKASDDINFSIKKGELVALLGPSGSGKTTILRMIAGIESANSGDILIDNKIVNNIPGNRRGIGFVFQSYALFRYMTVFDNIAFGLKVNKWNKSDIKARVNELIELVGLKGLEKRYPSQLSGGQRQRVAFARALAPNPAVLLLDEPFAAIDAKVRQELRSWLKEMIKKVGITSIFVTHDQEEAVEVADKIIVTSKGKVEQIGTPQEIYKNPRTAFVAKFMGQPSELENINYLKGFQDIEKSYKAIIRPENIKIYKEGEKLQHDSSLEEGVVKKVLFKGKDLEVTVQLKGGEVKGIRQIEESQIEEGEVVKVCIYRAFIFKEDQLIIPQWNANIIADESVVI